jgi:hypothetical protein
MRKVKEERLVGGSRVIDEFQAEIRPEKGRVPRRPEQLCIAFDRPAIEIQWFLPALGQVVATLDVLIGKENPAGPDIQNALESALPRG